jgi:glutaredoxin 2
MLQRRHGLLVIADKRHLPALGLDRFGGGREASRMVWGACNRRAIGAGTVRLYMFEHCSLCFRVRMTAALKRRHLQETEVLDDDNATMVSLVGKRVIPILVKDDGTAMLESMEMVRYVDNLGGPVLTGGERPEIAAWAARIVSKTAPLTMPRYPLLGLPEFATVAALDHYNLRKRKTFGDFVELRADTRRYVAELLPDLEDLDRLIESPLAINGTLSLDDVRVLPLLRSLGVVKGFRLPQKVRDYFESMMNRIGYQPLPAV